MARTNKTKHRPRLRPRTHEGAPAETINTSQQLRRSVLSCLLWEDEFYEDGHLIAARITSLAMKTKADQLEQIADVARNTYHLRHVPLLLAVVASKRGLANTSRIVKKVIKRVDEIGELLSLHWKMGGKPRSVPAQFRKGIIEALYQFDEYQLAKYDRKGVEVKLVDIFNLTHPKPRTANEDDLFRRVIEGKLARPNTWESAMAEEGANKKEVFERLLNEGSLPYFALLRNLRGMLACGVRVQSIKDAILARKGAHRILPFRYVAAARHAPQLERELDIAMLAGLEQWRMPGSTAVLVDVSQSMEARLSHHSDLTRMDAAAALAVIVPDADRYTFSSDIKLVPPRQGMGGIDAIIRSQPHSTTYLGRAVGHLNAQHYDRLIVITDEQSHDVVPRPRAKNAYMINVASARNGVGYDKNGWVHLDGFSENVLRFIREFEGLSVEHDEIEEAA